MKNIFVLGSTGQLGTEIKRLMPDAVYLTRDEVDLSSELSIRSYFEDKEPSLIINCAAYTQVDRAETERDLAFYSNAISPAILASLCDKFIHFSTDYVFNGNGYKPYLEEMTTGPTGVYGESKLQGESAVLQANSNSVIIRTSWVYSDIGNNFVKTMIRLGKDRKELKVVCDQIGSPTYAHDLADIVVKFGVLEWKFKPGIYHFSNEGVASWYDFAREIMDLMNIDCRVLPIKSEDYPTPAKRPHYSVLDKTKIKKDLGIEIPHWKESLKICLQKLS